MEGAASVDPIKTIAILDLETTGLFLEENNETRITEVAVVACERTHILNVSRFPRVVHKLTIPINPGRHIIDVVLNKTGLSNELLKNLYPFDGNFIQILKLFLKRLPQPVCLIAQNGHNYDFPLLQRQLSEFNSLLSNDLYCIDSKEVFRTLIPHLGQNYSLEKVYRILHDYNPIPNAHTAEGDCLALLSCIIKKKEEFFAYMDQNLKKFSIVQPLRRLP